MLYMYDIRFGAIGWKIPYFLSIDNSNLCIFPGFFGQNNHFTKFDLANLGQVQFSQ